MKRIVYFITIIISLVLIRTAVAQSQSLEIELMLHHFKNFEYRQVITIAEKLLVKKEDLSTSDLLKVYELKAISHYSLAEMEAALNNFIELLKNDPDYTLDPARTSPKIMSFFQQIKTSLQTPVKPKTTIPQKTKIDTVHVYVDSSRNFRKAMARSIVIPGWGHLYLGHKKKGWLLTTSSLAGLGASLYFLFDCEQKQTAYLNEINLDKIASKYDQYNNSYRTRNLSMICYSLIWIYSQADLLTTKQPTHLVYFTPDFYNNREWGMSLAIRF
jgi:hypothetical protein